MNYFYALSIENVDYADQDQQKELEADHFTIKCTFNIEYEKQFLKTAKFDRSSIVSFAKKFNTHPALIIARLHKRKLIHYNQTREYLVPINLEEITDDRK